MSTATGHNPSILTADQLVQQLQLSLQSPSGGTLLLKASSGETLGRLRFHAGKLLWAIAGQHRWRRWQRLLNQFCPTLEAAAAIAVPAVSRGENNCEEFETLNTWVQQQKLTADTAALILRQSVQEALFDLLQQSRQVAGVVISADENLALSHGSIDAGLLPNALAALEDAQRDWSHWHAAQLGDCSPDLAPMVRNAAALQQRTSPQTYQTLSSLLNGQSTLRELAVLMRQDLLMLTKTLVAYTQWDLIGLSLIPDVVTPFSPAPAPAPASATHSTPPPAAHVAQNAEAPLVLCIDDNPKVGEMLGKILTSAGYRYAYVQDSLEALTILLEKKPDFVFLDLVMPVASGYEVCSQIRRIAAFKDTPVVILTGNDGIIDRIRSKASGSTDFISKPLDVQKVLATLRQYLPDRVPGAAAV